METILETIDASTIGRKIVDFVPNLVAAVLILLLFWVLYLVTAKALRRVLKSADLGDNLVRLLVENVYKSVILILGIVMAANNLGINVAAALAGLGVAGIALGFAAQDSVSNVIAGFLIFWDKPFVMGDHVTVEGHYGRVSNITLRTTRVRTLDNTYVVIPNKNVIDTVVVNHTKHGKLRIRVPVGIAYKESIEEAQKVILAAVRKLDGILEDPEPAVVTEELAGSSVNLSIRVWIDDASGEKATFFRVTEAAKLALDEADIEIPFPHLQLFLDDVEDRVWEKLSHVPALSQPAQKSA